MIESAIDVYVKAYQRLSESSELWKFIADNSSGDETELLLRHREILGVPIAIIAHQITGRRKSRTKIPTYANRPEVLYPPGLNLEQSSSEKTASFKAKILAEVVTDADQVVDLTGGFGIDTYFFSRVFQHVEHVEPNPLLSWLAKHNHRSLGADNISYHGERAEQFLKSTSTFSACFIDPSRRVNSGKVVQLKDCEPDILELQSAIFKLSPVLLIKTSPLLDITQALRELNFVQAVYVVSVDQECKELLFFATREFVGEPKIHTVHLKGDTPETFEFRLSEEKALGLSLGTVRRFLYEPNPSIMKAGAYKSLAKSFSLDKIHPNSHFYSSEQFIGDFPGRIFEIRSRIRVRSEELRSLLPDRKANVVVRNYPLTADQLKKRLKLSDGGDDYVIGTTSTDEGKLLLLASRLK
jgi:SAM-dependent methyltransferases related to tRNA (uracil-5-)-methyltransferase